MVDFADGRILRQEQAITATQLADVTREHEPTGHRAPIDERDAAEHHGDVRSALDLDDHVRAQRIGRAHDPVIDTEIPEREAFRIVVHAEPVQRRHRVRRVVLDATEGVEHEHTVADARRFVLIVRVALEWVRPGFDHASEAIEHLQVGALELTHGAGERQQRLACEHGDHLAAPANRNRDDAHGLARIDELDLAFGDALPVEHLRRDGPIRFGEQRPHQIGAIDGLCGGGAHMAEQREVPGVRVAASEKHEVGEAQVREQAPRPHKPLQVHDTRTVECTVLTGEVGDACHTAMLERRCAPLLRCAKHRSHQMCRPTSSTSASDEMSRSSAGTRTTNSDATVSSANCSASRAATTW
ncbi:unannotated protein [freshwater metagenome]|uniref:Unannotated protein n=1 Tax=freshwater metagenome TaxID=449393 RepID=A0A6J7NFJ7_9ZZZZ